MFKIITIININKCKIKINNKMLRILILKFSDHLKSLRKKNRIIKICCKINNFNKREIHFHLLVWKYLYFYKNLLYLL